VLCEKLLPAQRLRFYQLSIGRIHPHWWEDFKKEWKKCVVKGVNENFLEKYYVDSNRWICSCPSFLQNRFLICKHLVKVVGGTATRLIYEEFKRNYEYPFLILKPLENTELQVPDDEPSSAVRVRVANNEIQRNEQELEESVPISTEEFEKGISELEEYMSYMRKEFDAGNLRHVKVLMDASKKVRDTMADIRQRGEKRVRERTWERFNIIHNVFERLKLPYRRAFCCIRVNKFNIFSS